jgi:hypothetical protein
MNKRTMPNVALFVLTLFIFRSSAGCISTATVRSNPAIQSKVDDSSGTLADSANDSIPESPDLFVPSPSGPELKELTDVPAPAVDELPDRGAVVSTTTIPIEVSPSRIDNSVPLTESLPFFSEPLVRTRSSVSSVDNTNDAHFSTSIGSGDLPVLASEGFLFSNIAARNSTSATTDIPPPAFWMNDANRDPPVVDSVSDVDSKLNSSLTNSIADSVLPSWMNLHVQATTVTQAHPSFNSPYVGAESFVPVEPSATSQTVTGYLAMRLAETTELIFDPELITGQGLSNVFGIAAYPNGEMNRASGQQAIPFIGRLFVRQVWGLGGAEEDVPEAFNQVAGTRNVDRVTLSVGKLAPTDIFDDNKYSHDPRTQFLDWALMYNAAWDYPADLRGYSYGGSIDLNRQDWALRYGIFAEPAVANQMPLDPKFLQAHGQVVEWEQRHQLKERPGKVRMLAYLNKAQMGSYALALAEMPVNPDITTTRDYRYKYGFGANFEQELFEDVGVFSRFGWNDGHTETWAFTEMDSLASAGLSVMGSHWGRAKDQVGVAGVLGGLSSYHRAYLAAGGVGIQLGDGKLNYGLEKVVETYYRCELRRGIQLSTAFQGVENPGFNRDRGPVAVGTVRLHFEF